MSNRSIGLSDALYDYLIEHSLREPAVLRRLREETMDHPQGGMQIAPEQGQFMALLCRMLGAKKTLDIGVFTGYSALSVARVLPDEGTVTALDVSEDYTQIARRYWKEAGLAGKIDLRLAPAEDSLDALLEDGQAGTFDFAFIDADKTGYDAYYERGLELLRPGGVVALDNVFRGGEVTDPDTESEGTQAIRALNTKLHADERIHLSMLPVADGLTLAMKR